MSFNGRSAALSSVTLRSLSPSSARLLASSADLAVARSAPDRASRSREMSRLLSSRRFAFCVLTLLSSTPTPLGVLSASSLSLRGAFALAWDASVRLAALAFSFWVVDMGVARVVASAGVFMDEADAAGVLPRLGFMRVDAFGFDAFSSLETPNMRDFLPFALGDGVAYSPLLLTSRSGERTFMVGAVGRERKETLGSHDRFVTSRNCGWRQLWRMCLGIVPRWFDTCEDVVTRVVTTRTGGCMYSPARWICAPSASPVVGTYEK